jgi:DNA-binding MarR family transcriptional regulator
MRDPTLAMTELVNEGLAERGFSDFRPAHGTVGQHIKDSGSRVTDLAHAAQLTKPTVVYLVDDLERLGYVERVPDPSDGRAKLVRLTERGTQVQQAARDLIAEIEHDWGALLGPRDFATLRKLLERLHDALWPASGANPS